MMSRSRIVLAVAVTAVLAATAICLCWAAPTAAVVRELPLPQVPATLTRPADRADYLLTRFWDSLDFADTDAGGRDTAFMEQNFVNFASIMPHASADSTRRRAVASLLDRAAADPSAFNLVVWLAEVYLNSTDSPMYSEEAYIMFLRQLTENAHVDAAMRQRYEAQLAEMAANRPGDIATDLPLIVANGSATTLLELAAAHDSTLIVMYDPDCHDCHTLIESLSGDANLRRAVDDGSMAIVAMYPYSDTELWSATVGELPSWWTVARSEIDIDEAGIYYIPRTPRTYLLDRAGRIVRLRE